MTALSLSRRWWCDERGQDLVEYTLLLTFVVLSSAALFIYNVETVKTIWDEAGATLLRARSKGI
jgi:Flp pilus assembly pilin Flp